MQRHSELQSLVQQRPCPRMTFATTWPPSVMSIPAIYSNSGPLLAAIIVCTVVRAPAIALVGGAQLAQGNIARQIVMVENARGAHCTGTLLARDIVLTAAHCLSGMAGLTVYTRTDTGTEGRKAISVALHPQYDAGSYARAQATVDLALLKLELPLPEPWPVVIRRRVPLPGERFAIAGFGAAASRPSAGLDALQTATLIVAGEPSSLQLRLVDPVSRGGAIPGLGSCDGDSGGPVFAWSGRRLVLMGILSWSNGPSMSTGCGGISGATPLARHREWIVKTAREIGGKTNLVK